MAKMTIAQMREKDIVAFESMTGASEEITRKIFNSFYRYSGLEQRLLILENDSEVYFRHKSYIEREEEKAERWRKRLNAWLAPYGLTLFVSGGYPKICVRDPQNGSVDIKFYGHYYN